MNAGGVEALAAVARWHKGDLQKATLTACNALGITAKHFKKHCDITKDEIKKLRELGLRLFSSSS